MSQDSKITELKNLPETGLLRLKQVLQFIPVSRSSWFAGVKTGRFPKPVKLGVRTTAWRAADLHVLINHGVQDKKANISQI